MKRKTRNNRKEEYTPGFKEKYLTPTPADRALGLNQNCKAGGNVSKILLFEVPKCTKCKSEMELQFQAQDNAEQYFYKCGCGHVTDTYPIKELFASVPGVKPTFFIHDEANEPGTRIGDFEREGAYAEDERSDDEQ